VLSNLLFMVQVQSIADRNAARVDEVNQMAKVS
jgi:hypothetical protein